jgi:hypothetical protein
MKIWEARLRLLPTLDLIWILRGISALDIACSTCPMGFYMIIIRGWTCTCLKWVIGSNLKQKQKCTTEGHGISLTNLMSRNFYNILIIIEFFLNPALLPIAWNNGIVGFQRILSILNFIVPPLADHLPNSAVFQDPVFQYSSIPSIQLWAKRTNAMFSYRIDKFQGIIFSIASGTITKADVIDLHKKFQ